MHRALRHYWPTHLAVGLAVAVCGAVLTGALLVGDSVRGSLRDLTLDRLGAIDVALLGERFFRADLSADLLAHPDMAAQFDRAVGAILLRGNAVHGESRARASQINVIGVSDDVLAMVGDSEASSVFNAAMAGTVPVFDLGAGGVFPPVVLNAALADALGAVAGDQVLLRFQIGSAVPADTLLGERSTDDVVGTIRAEVESVIPNRGVGRFDLTPHQSFPLNAYIRIPRLQSALDQPGRVNAILLGGALEANGAAQEALAATLTLEDLGLTLTADPAGDFVEVSSDEFVLRPPLLSAIDAAVGRWGLPVLPLQAYLANAISFGEARVPYSMVLAVDPPTSPTLGTMTLQDGPAAGPLGPDQIMLNAWTANQLGAAVGDQVEMAYYVVGLDERLRTESHPFEVAGILAMRGLAADPDVTPEYPGIRGVENIADWDPPFPVDLGTIRPVDEQYWDDYRGTPKAFVASATGARLWATRYGATTALRVAVPTDTDATDFAGQLRVAIEASVVPAQLGYRFMAAKQRGLEGAAGATDFAGLFVAFSFFIIFAALLIVAMLFNLGVDVRAREIGTLRALGFPASTVRNRLLAEALVVAAAGGLVGVGAGVGYAALMLWALTTIWLPAVGSPLLFLHTQPATLGIGFGLTVTVAMLTIVLALRRLRALPPTRLLAGVTRVRGGRRRRPQRARWLAPLGLGSGIGLVGLAIATDQAANPGLAFAAGAALLVGGLSIFALWNDASRASVETARGATLRMALRSAGWNPNRSLLSVTLVAAACFVIATVASNTRDPRNDAGVVERGAGGYDLLAWADVPLHHDLNSAEGRFELGFSETASSALAEIPVVAMRSVPGDDASCLNLYQPERPRLLGVPATMTATGGFDFAASLADSYGVDNPWDLLDSDLGPDVIPVIGDANSMQWILKLAVGSELVIANERGESVRLLLVGTLRESIFQSDLLLADAQLRRHFPSRSGFSFFLIDAPATDLAMVSTELESTLERFGFDVTSSAQRIADFLMVQNTYLSTFQALGGLGLLLGTFGLGVVLLRNVVERRGELATLRAIGFPRRALARMVLAENAVMLVAGLLIGTGAAVVAVAPRLYLGELALPWQTLAVALITVVLVGMGASLGAVALTSRIPLLPALKGEG
jgi:ABC-type antimicrobial peptide transport system permease subunit